MNSNILQKHIGLRSATALVVANIIGAGIFTTTGFQAADLGHPLYIFLLWIVGGCLAFFGAVCYAELGSMMPHAGGEYAYLRDTYGPALGFMSAFVSLVAGFSAPVAAATKAFIQYLAFFFPLLEENPMFLNIIHVNDLLAISVLWVLIGIHLLYVKTGLGFNDLVTFLKVGGIVLILLMAFAIGKGELSNLTRVSSSFHELSQPDLFAAFGTSLIFVMFCFSGWNASAYVASEMKNPQKDLPRSLLFGTGIVLALYLGLNAIYFYGADVDQLSGKVEVGLVASRALFGPWGVTLVTTVICISLLASASAMTFAGPRVSYALGRDFLPFSFLAKTGGMGSPAAALLLQGVVTSIIIISGTIDQIQQYTGFTLTLFASLAVSCVIVLRLRKPEIERPFRAWGYPFSPVLFLLVSVWMMYWAFHGRPVESLLSLATVGLGGLIFYLASSRQGSGTPTTNT